MNDWYRTTPQTTTRQRGLPGRLALLVVLLLVAVIPVGQAIAPRPATAQEGTAADWAAPRTVYIPATGHHIDGWFLDLWREDCGAAVFGNPVTPEFTRDGAVVQYYEFARFEYWVEGNANGERLVFGDIGADLRPVVVPRLSIGGPAGRAADMTRIAQAWEPLDDDDIRADSDSYRYITETGHGISDGFLRFWEDSGLQWYLGNPITEEYVVGDVHYQVFDRGQMTWQAGGRRDRTGARREAPGEPAASLTATGRPGQRPVLR